MRIIQHRDETTKLIFIRMTRDEALKTIESLATQLYSNNPNTGRFEHFSDEGIEFSISVIPEYKHQSRPWSLE